MNVSIDVNARLLLALLLFAPGLACAEDASDSAESSGVWALHGQATLTEQVHPAFTSPYVGPNSLNPSTNGRETFDATLYAGVHPWTGGEIWINPEIDQGFGLSDTLGVAGFPSGEAYKVGKADPYLRLPRLFLRQTIDLGGQRQTVDGDLNQFAGARTADRLVFTIGKFAVTDVFDTNSFAHDPKNDFLNWSLIDTGTFDYAANAWGYTVGAAAEWYQGPWTLRLGAFALSDVPNSTTIDSSLHEFQLVGEIERRYSLGGRNGAVRVTAFDSRGDMGSFADALALARATGQTPSTALVRHYQGRPGVSLNLEQKLTPELGVFARAGLADGNIEPYEFTDIDRTVAVGLSLGGGGWGRKDDTVGLAGVINQITKVHQDYLAAGGIGILVGDGQLPHPGPEQILETYYSVKLNRYARLSIDYQFIDNPAYNRDRGPVSVFGVRLHGQF